MLGVFFSSTLWVGLSLCTFSCLLQKMNDSGGYVEFAALLAHLFVEPITGIWLIIIIIIIIIYLSLFV